MNKIIKDACILFAITLVAGIVLGAVYNITKGPIAEQNEKAKQTAYREVLSDADSFEAIDSEKYSEANLAALVSGLKDTEEDFSTAEYSFYLLGDYKDSPARKKMCHEASLKAGRESLRQELASLRGFFTGKRRKEIEARLAEIEAELKKL